MKAFAIALLSVSLIGGAYSAAIAQSGSSPAPATEAQPATPTTPADPAPAKPADAPAAKPEAPAASGSVSGSGTVSGSTTKSDDNVSALPRSSVTTERTTIFGLSPTAAVIIAAALLLVVILAIVAMTRTNDTYIDTNRRV
jgi:hypothetical protein